MTTSNPAPAAQSGASNWMSTVVRLAFLAVLLYAFLVSIGMLGKSFKLFGGGFVDGTIQSASYPLVGLFVGVLVTTLVQSSSTTTSLVVALVGAGTMPVSTAIPVIMGANIGTSVTNTLVSLGHVTRSSEYERAVGASTVHDFFNIIAVAILFPLQVSTDFLGRLSGFMADVFQEVGGLQFASPLKIITKPAVNLAADTLHDHPWALLGLALLLLFVSLRYLVSTLKSLVIARVEAVFDVVIFKNAGRALFFGLVLTVLVQSSSITTSLVVPLAGAGLLSLQQIFPYTLGANVGTTITAMLAALAVGEVSAVTVAFAHFLFNIFGIVLVWPIKRVREIPVRLARRFGRAARTRRWLPMLYIVVVFYMIPFVLVLALR